MEEIDELDGDDDDEIELAGAGGVNIMGKEMMDVERPLVNDSSMDGDIEDGDG